MKKNDTLIILIAIWAFLNALGALSGVVSIAVFAFPTVAALWNVARIGAIFGLSLGIIVLLAYLGLSLAAGIGLITGKEWGRISAIIHASFSLFNIPVGTIIGVLTLIYLTKPEVKEYFETVRK